MESTLLYLPKKLLATFLRSLFFWEDEENSKRLIGYHIVIIPSKGMKVFEVGYVVRWLSFKVKLKLSSKATLRNAL